MRGNSPVDSKNHQYGLQPHIAIIIHKAMGGDFGKIASNVYDDGINGFHLWERGQVIVLLSRVHTSKDLIFVSDRTLISRTFLEILSSTIHLKTTNKFIFLRYAFHYKCN